VGPTPERRMSWRPGAEGALRERVVLLGWEDEGTILIDMITDMLEKLVERVCMCVCDYW